MGDSFCIRSHRKISDGGNCIRKKNPRFLLFIFFLLEEDVCLKELSTQAETQLFYIWPESQGQNSPSVLGR